MKNLILIALILTVAISCKNDTSKKDNGLQEVRIDGKTSNADIVRMPVSAEQQGDQGTGPKLEFEKKEYDFGSVTEGVPVKFTYKFKNVGNAPLLITDIHTTCGCTVPTWNKNPIPVGASDEIKVAFDTSDKLNQQSKKITVIANTYPSETELILKGYIKEPTAQKK
jgi:hypothetical protein